MEIAHWRGPGEHYDSLLDPDDEQPSFIPADIRGRGGRVRNKHGQEKGRDKKDRHIPVLS